MAQILATKHVDRAIDAASDNETAIFFDSHAADVVTVLEIFMNGRWFERID
jgi:hypothetical protein